MMMQSFHLCINIMTSLMLYLYLPAKGYSFTECLQVFLACRDVCCVE